jgi:hypothetical protein
VDVVEMLMEPAVVPKATTTLGMCVWRQRRGGGETDT